MKDTKIKKTFTIETSEEVMARFERFLALLHYNSKFGHSGLFAMPLDCDGIEKIDITPTPNHKSEVDFLSSVGYDVEIALNDSFSGKNIRKSESYFYTKLIPVLIKEDTIIKIPMDLNLPENKK